MSPHVTVVLCARNARPFIRACVRSVLRQSHRNLDVYVVDDASMDGTAAEVLDLVRADRRAHLVRLARSVGPYAAKNLVLARFCEGEYFAHQDADDLSRETRLERQLEFLDSHPDVPACGTAIDEFFATLADAPRGPSQGVIRFRESDGCYHRDNVYARRVRRISSIPEVGDLSQIKLAMNGSLVLRAHDLKQLGGYDGRTVMAGDTELLWRMLCLFELANLHEVLYARRFHAASLTRSTRYGFDSRARLAYTQAVRDRLQGTIREARGVVDLARRLRQDMHVPPVAFEHVA